MRIPLIGSAERLRTDPGRADPASDEVAQSAILIRSPWLAILGSLALVAFLRWAHEVLVPIALSVLLSYALTPAVDGLRRFARLPNPIGAAFILVALLASGCFAVVALQPQALAIVDLLPQASRKVAEALGPDSTSRPTPVQTIQLAATEIEKAAIPVPPSSPGDKSTRTSVAPTSTAPPPAPRFNVRDYLWSGTMGAVTAAGQLVLVIALVYFLLIAGDSFRRTLLQISEGTLSSKKITLQMLDEIHRQIQRYLLVQLATSALLGVLCGVLFAVVGLDNPATWGVVGAILHLIPYVGPLIFVGLIALVSFVQFDAIHLVLVLIGGVLVTVGVIGLLIVPWLTHRTGTLNAVAVFVALLVWGWLWGIWGLLLGVPLTMAVKALCDRIDNLRPLGAFLGHSQSGRLVRGAETADTSI
jgi:predicted PurR-regulated permease PerM